jgi:hypothetical protein
MDARPVLDERLEDAIPPWQMFSTLEQATMRAVGSQRRVPNALQSRLSFLTEFDRRGPGKSSVPQQIASAATSFWMHKPTRLRLYDGVCADWANRLI